MADSIFKAKKVVRLDNVNQKKVMGLDSKSKWVNEVMLKTVVETISFYADNGDIQTAAFMMMVFYDFLSPIKAFDAFISRIIISYLQLLKSLQLHSHITEILKFGPKIKDIDKYFKVSFLTIISRSLLQIIPINKPNNS